MEEAKEVQPDSSDPEEQKRDQQIEERKSSFDNFYQWPQQEYQTDDPIDLQKI